MRRVSRSSGSSRSRPPAQNSPQPHFWLPSEAVAISSLAAMTGQPPSEFRAGDWLMTTDVSGPDVYCIHRGIVGLRRRGVSGRLVFLRLLYPGEIYVAGGLPVRKTSLQAVTGGRASVIKGQDLLQGDWRVRDWLIAAQQAELEKSEKCIVDLTTLSASAMLARHLLDFSRLGSRPGDEDGVPFLIPMSRLDLANLIGIRPETLARLLRGLVSHGYIEVGGRHATVLDAPSLRRIAMGMHDVHQKED